MILLFKRLVVFSAITLAVTFVSCKKDDTNASVRERSVEEVVGEMSVVLNPYNRTPLAAKLDIQKSTGVEVQIEVLGEAVVSKTYSEDYLGEYAILGLYPDTTNTVALRFTDNQGNYAIDTIEIETHALDSVGFPDIEIITKDASKMEPGMHLAGLHLARGTWFATNPIIFDNNGDIRYYLSMEENGAITWPVQRFSNGNFMMGANNNIYEVDMLGKIIHTYNLANYSSHHDIIELPNGNLLAAVNKSGSTIMYNGSEISSTDDHIIEIDRASGAVVTEWDMREILDVSRHDLVDGIGDWFHMNAVWYSEADDCIIVSGRQQGLIKVTRDNQLKWIMAGHRGWGNAGWDGSGDDTKPYLLNAVDGSGLAYDSLVQIGEQAVNDFDWTWGQHAPLIKENGNILVFDNGFNRNYGNATTGFSRAVEYRIDEENKTVTQVWEYGKDRAGETYSMIISDVDIMPQTKNVLFTPGIINNNGEQFSRIVEVSYPFKTVVFEAKLNFKSLQGDGSFAWGQMDICYRSERVSLYP